jgi:hypothetical protein
MTETEQQAIESYNAGLAHMRAGRLAEARVCYEHALAIRPRYGRAHHNLAAVLDDLGAHESAEAHFRAAIAADPNAAEPWAGLAGNQRLRGRLGAARQAYEHALGLRVEFPTARWNLALIDLAEGKFAAGWMNYLFRPTVDRKAAPLVELPSDLSGTVIEIVDEQGLGDALFFLRFAPLLRARGAAIRYHADPRLAGIVSRMLEFGTASPNAGTIRVALGDLPYLLNVETCPPPLSVPVLADRNAALAARLREAGPPPYVGLTWRAGQRTEGFLFKEVPLEPLGRAVAETSGTLVSVQRNPQPGDHAQLEQATGRKIADLSSHNDDLEDMLALMHLLDDYVGVSNTNIHLRAATGTCGRVLIPNPAEYRWMAAGNTSPWFAGFHLYRQAPDGPTSEKSWDAALTRLAGDLQS